MVDLPLKIKTLVSSNAAMAAEEAVAVIEVAVVAVVDRVVVAVAAVVVASVVVSNSKVGLGEEIQEVRLIHGEMPTTLTPPKELMEIKTAKLLLLKVGVKVRLLQLKGGTQLQWVDP